MKPYFKATVYNVDIDLYTTNFDKAVRFIEEKSMYKSHLNIAPLLDDVMEYGKVYVTFPNGVYGSISVEQK